MEFKPVGGPLELNDVFKTLRLKHFKLRGVCAHIKERNLLVHDDFFSFFVIFDMLPHHAKKID